MRAQLLRINGTVERDPAIYAWMKQHGGELGAIAHKWFEVMRKCILAYKARAENGSTAAADPSDSEGLTTE